jgi:polyisoprenoid-binding protein YceI
MSKRNGSYCLVLVVATIGVAAAWMREAIGVPSKTAVKAAEGRDLKPGEIDVEKSRVYVRVGKKGLGHEHAVEGNIKSGSIDLSAKKDLGEIEFDMQSFGADTDEARKYVELKGTIAESTREQVTQTMLGNAVLDVEKFPTARFKIKSKETIEEDGKLRYVLK